MLKGKKIILGISGSIAAYKSAVLARLFVKAGAQVKVVMTKDAEAFITPLTLATLTKNPVQTEFVKNKEGEWNNHVELGLWADLMVIAPASANTLAKMANGLCDNLLLATYLSARCKVIAAPAMDLDMYAHPATQQNIAKLKQYGNLIIDANSGELASGLFGTGRLAEPEEIVEFVIQTFSQSEVLKGKKVLITAGPTYEAIDPVRFIGNHSSGKMGFALAETFANHGAEVFLVAGPTDLTINHQNVKVIDVKSAEDMFNQSVKLYSKMHIAVMSAAVADYTPDKVSKEKIKKSDKDLTLKLKKTKDILKQLGTLKTKKQILVGFALETNNEEANALKKLNDKNADFIVLNSLKQKGAGFGYDTNQITILHKNGTKQKYPLKSKMLVASDIVTQVINLLHA